MRVTIDSAGVVLAFVIAGAAVGSWSALITIQLHALRKEVCKLRELVTALARVIPV